MHSRFLLTLGVAFAASSAARLSFLGSGLPEARLTRSIVAAKSAGVEEVLIASAEALRAEVVEEGQWLSLVGDPAEVSVGHTLGTARLMGMAKKLDESGARVAEMEVALAAAEREAAALELEVAHAAAKRQSAAERDASSAEEARRVKESTQRRQAEAEAAAREEERAAAEEAAAAEAAAAAAAAARPTADGPQGAAPGAAPGGIEGAPASADAAPVATHPSSLHAGAAAGLEPAAAAAAGAPRTAGSEAAAAAAAAAASCGGADLAPISDRIPGAPISDEAESEPICRICYATLEEGLQAGLGRLVSPCLCVGSMRFVHTECLQQWRSMAANPRSFYTCDNCLFRYSFRRTSVAQVLRSVLVLHLITSLLLLLLLLLGALLIALVDRTFFDSTMAQLGWITDALWQDATPPSDAEAGAEAEVHSKLVAPGLAWLGGWLDSGHLAYLLWSGLSLGVLGFLSLGMVGPILFGGHGRRGGGQGQEGILLL